MKFRVYTLFHYFVCITTHTGISHVYFLFGDILGVFCVRFLFFFYIRSGSGGRGVGINYDLTVTCSFFAFVFFSVFNLCVCFPPPRLL